MTAQSDPNTPAAPIEPPPGDRLREALQTIADDGCEENTGTWRQGFLDCLTYYPSDPTNWCPMCVAIAALAAPSEPLGDER